MGPAITGIEGHGGALDGGDGTLDWPTLFQNAERTAYRAEPLPPPLRWNRTYGSGGQLSPPVVWNGTLFYSTIFVPSGGLVNVSAADLQTGIERWRVSIPGTWMDVAPAITVGDGNVYVATVQPGTGSGYAMLSIDAGTGSIHWRKDKPGVPGPNFGTSGGFHAPAADGSDAIFVGEHDATVVRFGGRNGTEQWRVPFSPPAVEPWMIPSGWSLSRPGDATHLYTPVVSDGRLFVYGEHFVSVPAPGGGWNTYVVGVVHALDAATASTLWNRTIATTLATESRQLVATHGLVYVSRYNRTATSYERNVSALDAASGSLVWDYPLVPSSLDMIEGGYFGVSGDTLFLPHYEARGSAVEGYVAGHNASSGARLWKVAVGRASPVYLAGAGDTLYFTGWPSILAAISISSHRLIWSRTAGYVGLPALAGDTLYVSTTQGVAAYVRGDVPPQIAWKTLAPIPTARSYVMRGRSTIGDRIYVAGGWTFAGMTGAVHVLNASTGAWTTAAPMPVGAVDGIIQAVGGRLYAFGGEAPSGITSANWAYDSATNTWASRAPGVGRRELASAVLDEKVYAIGGVDSGGQPLGRVDVYDPVNDTWSSRAPHPLPRPRMTSESIKGRIYTFGGDDQQDRVHEYDPASDTWTEKSRMPLLIGFTNSVVINGTIFAVGGYVRTVLRYDDANDTWIGPLDDLPTTRYVGAVSEALGRIYVIGGYQQDILNVTEEGTISWTVAPPEPATMLPARLVGTGLADVLLSWLPSPDDGGGAGTLARYEVWSGQTYDATAVSYYWVASLPPGTTSYVVADEGHGDPLNHFYTLRAANAYGGFASSAQQAGKFVRPVRSGMNLVSVPFEQSDWNVATVLQTVPWSSVRTYVTEPTGGTWLSNVAVKPWASLPALDPKMGMWVNVSADANWTVAGLVPQNTSMTLRAGWNLLGYPSVIPRTLGGILAGVSYRELEGYAPTPPLFLMRLTANATMTAGDAYWVWHLGPDKTIVVSN